MNLIAILIITGSFICRVSGHSRLIQPLPFNQNPSKALPCGGQNSPISDDYVQRYNYSSVVLLNWQVIASDGQGAVSLKLDTQGGTNFQQSVELTGTTPNSLGYFDFTMQLPDNLPCQYGMNVSYCTAQVISTSGWTSCFAFYTGNFTNTVVIPRTQCVNSGQLQYCKGSQNSQVSVQFGSSATIQDRFIQQYYLATINNTAVMAVGGQSTECQNKLTFYLCGTMMPYCGQDSFKNSGLNQDYCRRTMSACGLTEQHIYLFNCSTLPEGSTVTSDAVVISSWITFVKMLLT